MEVRLRPWGGGAEELYGNVHPPTVPDFKKNIMYMIHRRRTVGRGYMRKLKSHCRRWESNSFLSLIQKRFTPDCEKRRRSN
jgi:hypothetical protein